MIKKYKLFTTPMCPNCPLVKNYLEEVDIEGEVINASEPEGLEEAKKFSVMQVPAAIFFDENNEEVGRAGSVDEVKEILGKG